MRSQLRNVLLAAGAGLVAGLCTAASKRRGAPVEPAATPDGVLRLDPLFDRLERIESNLLAAKDHPAQNESPVQADLLRRIEQVEANFASLSEQSSAIGANLQRLIAAIEKLCERPQAQPVAPPVLPFESILDSAQNESAADLKIRVKEADPAQPRRARFSMFRTF
jgi:hypothetical protein